MIEAANVSVGRGTDTPFELVGAPWIDGKALADQLNGRNIAGVRFEATTFTPREWAYAGQTCEGVRITLTDRNRLDRPLLGVELMAALWRLYGDRFQIDRTLGMIGSRASLAPSRRRPIRATSPAPGRPALAEFLDEAAGSGTDRTDRPRLPPQRSWGGGAVIRRRRRSWAPSRCS